MRYSKEYRSLQNRIDKLKKKFDFNERLTGPTREQMDELRSFLLLCHAELEEYFENTARKVLARSEKKWQEKHSANYNLASLFVKGENTKEKELDTIIGRIIARYKQSIEGNNGIKRENILKMFSPLGYKEDDFDSIFLNDLDSVGRKRGEFAHKSFKTVQIVSKKDAYKLIDRIIKSIEDFEIVVKSKEKNF